MRHRYTKLLLFASLGACAAPMSQSETTGVSSDTISAGQYQITPSYISGQCLEAAGGNTANMGAADIWSCSSSTDPNWNLVSISSGVYEIRQAVGGNCLTVNGANFANGTSLVLYTCQGQAGSRWNAVQVGSYTTFKSIDNTNKCMDIYGWGTANGSKGDIWDCNGGMNQQFALNATSVAGSLAATVSVSSLSTTQYSATLKVTNSSATAASNWQVALNMNQSTVDHMPSYGGSINNGSVYFNGGMAVVTPSNGATLPAGGTVQVTFTGDKTGSNWTPSIASVDGIAGSSAPLLNDSIDHIARAVATGAVNIMVAYESNRTTTDQWDKAILDSHMYLVSSDGSQIILDPSSAVYSQIPSTTAASLAAIQTDPSVASYLVTGLLSCFADMNGSSVYGFDASSLRGWSFTTTGQNITFVASAYGTDNLYRVGANVNGTEQITLKETVNPNSADWFFGLATGNKTGDFSGFGNMGGKYHGGTSGTCSPFNGPGGSANPYLIISLNGSSASARNLYGTINCSSSSNCVSTVVIDPVAYASAGQFYNGSGNLIGPSSNPFSLDPNVTVAYNPDHRGQWAQDVYRRWGQFSKATFLNGSYYYKWSMCSGGVFNPNGC